MDSEEELFEYLQENDLYNKKYTLDTNAKLNGFTWDKELEKYFPL